MAEDAEKLYISLDPSGLVSGRSVTIRSFADIVAAAGRTDAALGRTGTQMDATGNRATLLGRSLRTLIGSFAVKQIVGMADSYTLLEARLGLVTRSTSELTGAQRELFDVAQETRQGLNQTADLYTKIARNAEQLNLAQAQTVELTAAVGRAMLVSGAATQESSAAILQLGQAMASGRLAGDELRSILENSPRLARAIADGIGVTIGELRKMGKEGELTSQKVAQAILSQSEVLKREAASLPLTVGQSFTLLSNSVQKFIGEENKALGATASLAGGIAAAAAAIDSNRSAIEALAFAIGAGLLVKAIVAATLSLKAFGAAQLLSAGATAAQVAGYTTLQASLYGIGAAAGIAWRALLGPVGAIIAGVGLITAAFYSARREQELAAQEMQKFEQSANDLTLDQTRAELVATEARLQALIDKAVVAAPLVANAFNAKVGAIPVEDNRDEIDAETKKRDLLREQVTSLVDQGHFRSALIGLSREQLEIQRATTKELQAITKFRIDTGQLSGPEAEKAAKAMEALGAQLAIIDSRLGTLPAKTGPVTDEMKKAREELVKLQQAAEDALFKLGDPSAYAVAQRENAKLAAEFINTAKAAKVGDDALANYGRALRAIDTASLTKQLQAASKAITEESSRRNELKDDLRGELQQRQLLSAASLKGSNALKLETERLEDAALAARIVAAGLGDLAEAQKRVADLRRGEREGKATITAEDYEKETEAIRAQSVAIVQGTEAIREQSIELEKQRLIRENLSAEAAEQLARDRVLANERLQRAQDEAQTLEQLRDNAIRGLHTAISESLRDLFTDGLKGAEEFVGRLKDLFVRMFAELITQQFMKKVLGSGGAFASLLGIPAGPGQGGVPAGNPFSIPQQTSTAAGAAGVAVTSATLGYGIGRSSGNRTTGVVGGAAAGAAAGAVIGSVVPGLGTAVGAAVGAIVGGVAGLIGAAKSAKEAEKAMREAARAFKISMEAYTAVVKGTNSALANELRQNQITVEQLLLQANAALPGKKNEAERNLTRANIEALGRENEERIKQEFIRGLDEQIAAYTEAGRFANERAAIEREYADNLKSSAIAGIDASKATELYKLQMEELAKAEAAAARQRALETKAFELSLSAREKLLAGDDLGAARDQLELQRQKELAAARELVEQGIITEEMFQRLADVLGIEMVNALQTLELQIEHAKRTFTEDLEIRRQSAIDRVTGGDSSARFRQIANDREIRQARIDGRTPAEIRQIQFTQEVENLAYAFETETAKQLAAYDKQIDLATQQLQAQRDQARALDEQAKALEDQAKSMREQARSLREFVRGNLFDSASPEDRLKLAQEAFDRAVQGGDASQLQRAGQDYIDAARAYFGSGPSFQAIMQQVLGAATSRADQLDQQATALEAEAAALRTAAAALHAQADATEQLIGALQADRAAYLASREEEFALRLKELEESQKLREAIARRFEEETTKPDSSTPIGIETGKPDQEKPPVIEFPSLAADLAPVVTGVNAVNSVLVQLAGMQGAANPQIVGGLASLLAAFNSMASQLRLLNSQPRRSQQS